MQPHSAQKSNHTQHPFEYVVWSNLNQSELAPPYYKTRKEAEDAAEDANKRYHEERQKGRTS